MASTGKIVLYDIPSRPPNRCWSFNTWRIRLLLNYKGLEYETKWVEYPDIKPTLQEQTASKNKPGRRQIKERDTRDAYHSVSFPKDKTYFTCPTVRLEDGVTYIMDSYDIAPVLEQHHPTPPLPIEPPYLARLKAVLRQLQVLAPIYVPLVPERLLGGAPSVAYFHRTREEDAGMPLREFAEKAPGAWDAARAPLAQLTGLLKENGGPFFLGETVSYGDFIWVGLLLFFGRFGEDVQARLMECGGDASPHKRLLEAATPWTERDSF